MLLFEHLPNSPITEALFDIRVKSRPDFNIAEFSNLKPDLIGTFPKVEEMFGGQFTFQLRPDQFKTPEVQDFGVQGYLFKSEDEKLIAQFRVDGFTLNRLKPYTRWDELFPIAIDLWKKYLSIAKPIAVTRLALRYINQFTIKTKSLSNGKDSSVPIQSFYDYLTTAPQIPTKLPQLVNGFIYRVTIALENSISAHVSQVYQPSGPSEDSLIILDIDVFEDLEVPAIDPKVADHFSQLRVYKNRIFSSYLTEKTIKDFK